MGAPHPFSGVRSTPASASFSLEVGSELRPATAAVYADVRRIARVFSGVWPIRRVVWSWV